MKKIFTLIAATLLVAACSDDTDIRTGGDFRHISFGVTDGDAVSVMVEDFPATRFGMSPWAMESYEDRAADAAETVVAAETDMPVDERLCLSVTDEPFIRRRAYTEFTRGSLLNTVNTRSLVFGVTEFLKDQNIPVFANTVPVAQNTTLDGGRELFIADETWEDDAYDGNEYDFFAYAPSVEGSARGITLSNQNRTISYDPTGIDVGDQPDLMTARKATSAYVGVVPLTFQHRLCAIQIKTSGTWAQGYHVSGVTLTNVVTSGTFDVDTDKDDAWTTKGEKTDYTVTGIVEADATDAIITGGNKWLMMVPQTLDHAMISVTLTDGDSHSYTVTAPVNGSVWTAGHTVTYTVRPESIATMTVNYPAWNDGGNPVPGPVSTYDTTDQFGLFVLDKDGKILVSNQLVAPVAGSAAASRSLDIPTSIFKSKQYKYFLMYPYKTDAELETIVGTANYNSYYRQNATGRTANADAFFADVVANWTAATDQSTEATFKAQDLQIASLAGADFNMEHKMGLIRLTLPYKALIQTRTDNNGSITNSGTVYKTASSQFASGTLTPCLFSDEGAASGNSKELYCIVRNSATIASKTDVADAWSQDVSVANGSINAYTVNSTRTYWKYIGTYSNAGTPSAGGGYSTTSARGAADPSTVTYTAKDPYTVNLESGNYLMQCWGAKGENFNATLYGGNGGYTAGNIFLPSRTLFVYTGNIYGYNGGAWTNSVWGASGGGATDIRLVKGTASGSSPNWKDWDSRKSRIMVAGGGGGGGARQDGYGDGIGGYGGGLIGGNGTSEHHTNVNTYYNVPYGAGQDYGGYLMHYYVSSTGVATYDYTDYRGFFGYCYQDETLYWSQGGGAGGWYGGTIGGHCGTSGGSSYISGHAGCIAITEDAIEVYVYNEEVFNKSEISHRTDADAIDRSTHYSGLKFTNTVMVDGAGYGWTTARGSLVGCPKFSGSGTQNGNPDLVGHAKIETIPDD